MSQTLQSVLCITTDKYLVSVLVVLLHARFSVVGPIPFLLAVFFFGSFLYRKYYRTSRYRQFVLTTPIPTAICDKRISHTIQHTCKTLQWWLARIIIRSSLIPRPLYSMRHSLQERAWYPFFAHARIIYTCDECHLLGL